MEKTPPYIGNRRNIFHLSELLYNKNNMTSFARYYKERKLVNVTMKDIEKYITDETNKEKM
jgi:hypothetical protein